MSTAPARLGTSWLAGAGNRVVVGGTSTTWRDLPELDLPPAPLAVLAHDARYALAAARHHAVHGGELLLSTPGRVDEAMRAELREAGFTVTDLGADAGSVGTSGGAGAAGAVTPAGFRPVEHDRLWLLTSGSTGRPKRVGHTLASLTTVRGEQPARTWLCPYAPGTYAWWQVVTLSLTQPGQDLVVVEPEQLDDWPALAATHGVDAASGTPTFWRRTLHRDPAGLARVPLRQLTLGGEPVDQAILDRLREVFPTARISWIYASSEVGAAIVVHDGRAGFPAEWLDRAAPGRPTLGVRDGELVITSPHHGTGLAGPVHTGDRAQLVGDRVLITGRLDSDEINVGGSKVSAGGVRDVLTAHPWVAWARVTGRRAPLLGHMVVAEVVLTTAPQPDAPTEPTAADEAALVRWCAERLPDYAVPRRIRVLTEIPVKETLKSDV
ncbi:AMP-binding protein [Micromonospora endophytica]|uniref:Acyl-CoA synthetase n=1 Tax=Micromonospora endophytica TaxID=515350 RepID=A0A2W2CHZ9_9ACTN|nr:AMP-binding protein [Micromonospora endophytica]PZF92584.1 acyl-CoA synthetase [Micromonospora endophytica]RIW42565.1 long-chain fatty acid--CoA ligase [Micromonospora endophytica]BCJ57492.1 o-succinylbenzoate--CoA ligase [Micromonospora endophytica]